MSKLTILLVDDNKDDRRLTRRVLEGAFPLISLEEIANLRSLERALRRSAPDLVITEDRLAGADGLAVVQRIKDTAPECAVVIYTASGGEPVAGVMAMVDDYVMKSRTDPSRLVDAVRRVADRSTPGFDPSQGDLSLQAMFDNLPVGVYRTSPEGRILEANQALAAMLGCTSVDELLASDLGEFYADPLDRQRWREVLELNQSVKDFEIRMRRRDGSVLWVRDSGRTVRGPGGKVVCYEGTLTEASERRLAEERLSRSETELKNAQRVARVGSWAWHIPSNRLEWSDEMFRIFGIERQGFSGDLGEVVAGAIHPEDRAAVERSNRSVIEERKPMPLEYRIVRPDGTVRTVWAEAGELRLDALGNPETLTGIVQDISERKEAEDRLRRGLDQVQAVLQSSPMAIVVMGTDRRVKLWNPAAERMFGWTEQEVIGGPVPFVPVEKHEDFDRNVRRVLGGESLTGIDVVRQRKDGSPVTVRLSTAPLWDDQGRVTSVFAMLEDVSDRRRIEEAVGRRDAVLAAVGDAATVLLKAGAWEVQMPDVLSRLGQAMGVSRAYLFQRHTGPRGDEVVSQRHEWCARGIAPQIQNPELQNVPRYGSPFSAWGDSLERNEVVAGHAWQFPEAGPVFMAPEDIRSILLAPVFATGSWWGVIGFDECLREREWLAPEVDAARTAAGMLGAVIGRQKAERALEGSEDRFRRLAENAADVIYRYRLLPDRGFDYASPAISTVVGYAPDELYADPDLLVRLVHPEDQPRLLQVLDGRVAAAGALQLRWLHRDGRTVWIDMQNAPVVDERGRLVALEGIARDVTRRVEAEAAERRRAELLAELYKTSLEISAEVGVESLLKAIVDRAARLVGTSMGGLYLVTPDGRELEQVVDLGGSGGFVGLRLAIGEGVSGRAAASGEPYVVEDYRTWLGKAAVYRHSTSGRVLAVPLKTQGKIMGVLSLSDEAPGTFDEDEIRLATLFAEQAAVAIHNARLLDESRRHAAEMEALVETAVEISAQTDLDQLLSAIVDRAAGLLGLPVGGLYLLDEATQELEMVVSRYPDRDYVGTRIAIGEGVAGRAVELGGPFATENYAEWEGKAPVYDDVRLGRVLGVPLSVGKRIIGAVYVSDFQRGQFTPAEIRLVSLFADQAAVAIENSRLLASERQRSAELARSRALIESLSHVAADMERSTERGQLLSILGDELRRLGIDAWMGLLHPESGEMETHMLAGDAPGLRQAIEEVEALAGWRAAEGRIGPLVKEASLGGRPRLVPAIELARRLMPDVLPEQAIERLLIAANAGPQTQTILLPVVQQNRPVGLLVLWSDRLRDEDVSALSIFGAQVSTALEKAQLLDETRRRAAYLEALASVATALRVARDRDSMAPIILGQLLHLLEAQGSSLTLRDADTDGSITVLATGQWEAATGVRLGPGQGIVGQVLRTGLPKISTDIRTDPALARRELLRDIPAVACVPLTVQQETLGCLMVGRQTPFRDEDVRLLTAIAEMAGNALHRAEVMETLEKRVLDRTRALEEANDRLRELDHLKSDFVSNVTHELRTPITNIQLYLDLFHLATSAEKGAHYHRVLKSEAVRLGRLIEDLLILSRLERDVIAMEFEPRPLDALLAEVIVAQEPSAQARRLRLTYEPNVELPVALVSRTQIVQVFSNLMSNAVAYTPPGGWIRVSTARKQVGDRAFVGAVVSNNGPPIDADDLPHIFERFFRGRTGRESGQAGTGLGLAISREIVERHAGWIDVESREGETTFSVWVPEAPAG